MKEGWPGLKLSLRDPLGSIADFRAEHSDLPGWPTSVLMQLKSYQGILRKGFHAPLHLPMPLFFQGKWTSLQ